MQPDPDELAGVADLFGALTREELRAAFADLAARAGSEFDPDELDAVVDEAVAGYYLVPVGDRGTELPGDDEAESSNGIDGGEPPGGDGEESLSDDADRVRLASGPTALPRLPESGEDLPHLLDVDRRDVDREALGEAAHARLRGDAARAVDAGDDERIATLLDVCYDLEVWAPVETDELRSQLDDAL